MVELGLHEGFAPEQAQGAGVDLLPGDRSIGAGFSSQLLDSPAFVEAAAATGPSPPRHRDQGPGVRALLQELETKGLHLRDIKAEVDEHLLGKPPMGLTKVRLALAHLARTGEWCQPQDLEHPPFSQP